MPAIAPRLTSGTSAANEDLTIPTPTLLSPSELQALDARIAANADRWLEEHSSQRLAEVEPRSKSMRGRKPRSLDNPLHGFIGCTTHWGRYPKFAVNVLKDVARLDWHDRPIGVGGKSNPLSVRDLLVIIETLPVISNETIEDVLRLGERHARRYFKALQLAMPRLMEHRPQSLIHEMEGTESTLAVCQWEDLDDLCIPTAEELAKLHYGLRTLTEFKTAEEYEREDVSNHTDTNVVTFPTRLQHPKKATVMAMLAGGSSVKAIERETCVAAKTIRKWRDDSDRLSIEQIAA